MSAKPLPYLSFRIGDQWYGIPVDAVIEVLHLVALTELPAAPPHVLGLMTLRDMVMPVVDLRQRFGLVAPALHLDTHIVAAQSPSGPVGFVVDEVNDVEDIIAAARTTGHESAYVQGSVRLADRLMLLLDLAHIYSDVHSALPEHTG